jgi:Flp pilus assembly protein TadD
LIENVRLLLRIFLRPAAAMDDILDHGSLLFASIAVIAVSLLFQIPGVGFYVPLLVLAVFYVPGLLLLGRIWGTSAAFQRDYSPLFTCTGMAWAAANLPLALLLRIAPRSAFGVLAGLAYVYFGVLVFFAVRTVLGGGNRTAGAVVCLSWIPLIAAAFLWGPLRFILGWLASPFFLFCAYYYFGGELRNLGEGLRRRQNFRRMLDAATLNPHDADAQYQLGLIYQARRQPSEAIQRFKNAVAIDPSETDAHFQLGRIAREQGRLRDALAHFQTVVNQNERHQQNEILREVGAVHLTARLYEHAANELGEYIGLRPYDPEGLFYCGQALEGLGRMAEAREIYGRAVNADQTAPRYRRRLTAQWRRLAEKRLRSISD